MQIDDKAVIRRVKAGDIEAYESIVRAYSSPILGYTRKHLFQKEDAEDLVQNTFIQFYKAIYRFDESRPVLPYLFEIVKNELKMYYRKHRKHVSFDERINTIAFVPREFFDVKELLRPLPHIQRKALELVYEGYSYEEIAKKLQKKLNTVRTLIRRARLQITKIRV